jgi:PrtD family type I secretion system ABC transporter
MRAASARRRGARDAQRVLDNAETVVPLGMTRGLVGNWLARHGDARDAGGRSARTTETLAELSKVVRLTLQIAVLGVGAFFVLQGQLTAGGMIAASIILARALSPVERSIGAWRAYLAAREAHGRLKDFFASVSDASRTRLPAPQGNVSVTNLWWGPENAVEQVLKGVSFHVEAGKTLGIIGPTGAGKTTLCRLLTGSWSPVLGRIRLDGASLSDWDPDQLSEYIGYLPQTVELFPGTVAQNIARMTEANDADVVAAAKLAGCHELVLQLPKGYETDVGLHGANLSGGQLQRIGLARAMFGNPKLLVFDEPNSNLDAEGEHALMEALARLKEEGRTVVLVAHQPSMLRTADSVLILRDGKVAAFGSREETLGKIAPNANGRQLSAKANKRSGAGKRADPDASAAAMIGE